MLCTPSFIVLQVYTNLATMFKRSDFFDDAPFPYGSDYQGFVANIFDRVRYSRPLVLSEFS
jgi:hypothetical protein